MTQPPIAYDPANILLAPAPSRIDTAAAIAKDGSGQKLGMVTVRTSSATVTAILTPDAIREWAGILNELADKLGAGSLAPATMADVIRLGNAPR